MFKSVRQSRLIVIVLWVIAIFIAIVKLPSVTNLITSLNENVSAPSQIAGSEQLINANHLQHGWGRRLSHTSTADIVYNRRNGQITARQQSRINRRIDHLQKHAGEYGIQRITDLNSDRNGIDDLKSKDGSTEMVKLSVTPRYQRANANVWAAEIKGRAQVPTLRSFVTSPSLLKSASVRKTVHLTTTVTIVGLLLSSLAIGLIFRSLIAPFISLITLLITDLIALSLTSNLARWTGFSEYTPLAILFAVLTAGTITTYLIDRSIIRELPKRRDVNNAVMIGLAHVKRPVELSGLILTLAFGAAVLIPETNVRLIAAFGITFAVLTLGELTLVPTFTSWVGKDLIRPSRQYRQSTGHHLWNRLTRLSLWQPLIGIIAVVYFVAPFVYSYRNNVDYSQVNNVSLHNQAYLGSNLLNAHFTSGKATPVTIYLRGPQKFNREKTLRPVDELTTKLQSMPGVNAVNSVTQPSGMPVGKYYVDHQLTAVNDSLNRNQDRLVTAQKRIRSGQKKLGKQKLSRVQNGLSKLKGVKGQLPKVSLGNSLKAADARQRASVTGQINNYRNQLQSLNGKLGQLSGDLDSTDGLSNEVKGSQSQIKAVRKRMASTSKQIKRVNGRLNTIYSYLSGLQRSSASHQYFITPDQVQDTDFQQSLINFTSQDERTTKLQVIFNQAPSTRYNQKRIKRLTTEIRTELQGTPLSRARVAMSGAPVQQATLQRNFKRGMITALFILLGISLLGLILISRSILNPLFWLFSFGISSLAGFQITELIVRFATNQPQFNWQIMLSASAVLTSLSVIELVPISLAYRHRQTGLVEWLHETFTDLGQSVTTVLFIVTLTAVSLFSGATYQTAQLSLIVIVTVIIFNWVLPLLASAFGKYTQTLPHSKL